MCLVKRKGTCLLFDVLLRARDNRPDKISVLRLPFHLTCFNNKKKKVFAHPVRRKEKINRRRKVTA